MLADSGYASEASDDEDELESKDAVDKEVLEEAWAMARADQFERGFALKWMTGFICRGEEWAEDANDPQEKEGHSVADSPEARHKVLEGIAALLASCAGISASGPLTRTFNFHRSDKRRLPVSIELRDATLLSQDHTSVGLQTWGSSCLLAERLVRDTEKYGLEPWASASANDEPFPGTLRILELGSGTGLLSLVLGKLFNELPASWLEQPTPPVEIIATDFHQAVLDNLRTNVETNFHISHHPSQPLITKLDWRNWDQLLAAESPSSILASQPSSSPFKSQFDVIVGADIVYEPAHARWIKSCVQIFLQPGGHFHLIMPLRPTHKAETDSVPAVFPSAEDVIKARGSNHALNTNGPELAVVEVEELARVAGTGRADEVRYLLYRIGWI